MASKSLSQEQYEVFSERLFAHEKTISRQLLEYIDRLQHQEERQQVVESKLDHLLATNIRGQESKLEGPLATNMLGNDFTVGSSATLGDKAASEKHFVDEIRDCIQQQHPVLNDLRHYMDQLPHDELRQERDTMKDYTAENMELKPRWQGTTKEAAADSTELESMRQGHAYESVPSAVPSATMVQDLQTRYDELHQKMDAVSERLKLMEERPMSAEIVGGGLAPLVKDTGDRSDENINAALDELYKDDDGDDEEDGMRSRRGRWGRALHRTRKPETQTDIVTTVSVSDVIANMNEDVYMVEESIWDAALFAGFPEVELRTSILLGVGALGNGFVQICICIIMYLHLSDGDGIDDYLIDDLKYWRGWTGHYFKYGDSIKKTSLVRRLCTQDMSEFQSGVQYTIYSRVSRFLETKEDESGIFYFLDGVALSYLSELCWLCLVWTDLHDASRSFFAILNVPRGVPQLSYRAGRFSIRRLGITQVLVTSFVCVLPRMLIVILLGITGVWFLGLSASMADLLLNTTALSFVLDLDELFYQIVVPERIQQVIRQICTLHHPPSAITSLGRRILGRDAVVYTNLTITAAILICVHFVILKPFHAKLADVIEALCGGNQDFVFDLSAINDTIIVAATQQDTDRSPGAGSSKVLAILGYALDNDVQSHNFQEVQFEDIMKR